MKRRLALIALLGSLPLSAQENSLVQTLTLEQSLQRALQNNQKLLLAENQISISKQRVRQAKSQYFPQVTLNLNASRYLAEQDYITPVDFGPFLFRPSRAGEADNFYSARAWLRQPLYNGGRTRNTVLLAAANLQRAQIEKDQIRSQVIFNATKAFYDVLLAQKNIEICQEALARVQKASASRHRRDLSALQMSLRRSLEQKRWTAGKLRLQLLDTLGLELYTGVKLSGELASEPVQADLQRLLAQARESRLEIRQTDYQKEIDRLAINLSLAERYPTVALGAGYELNDREFPLRTTQWNTTLNVSLPIFDGLNNRSQIRQKRLAVNESRIRSTEIEDSISLEVRDSFYDLLYWDGEMKTRAAEMKRAREETAGEVNAESESWRLESQEAYWESVHGHRVARAQLEKAVGRPFDENRP